MARDLTAGMLTSETLAGLDAAFRNSGHDVGMAKRLMPLVKVPEEPEGDPAHRSGQDPAGTRFHERQASVRGN